MRIAIFTETFLPKVDGIVNTLCHLLDHLARHDHQSILFAPEGGPAKVARTPRLPIFNSNWKIFTLMSFTLSTLFPWDWPGCAPPAA